MDQEMARDYINAGKTAYTIFSLATKEQNVHIQVNNHALPQDKTPTYLGVTFNRQGQTCDVSGGGGVYKRGSRCDATYRGKQ